jgi:hypothetical protein
VPAALHAKIRWPITTARHRLACVEQSLFRDVEKTYSRFQAEAANFYEVTYDDLPSGIPYPDSATRISQAARSHNEALEAYRAALKRLNDYTLHGIVPVDLKSRK